MFLNDRIALKWNLTIILEMMKTRVHKVQGTGNNNNNSNNSSNSDNIIKVTMIIYSALCQVLSVYMHGLSQLFLKRCHKVIVLLSLQ